MNELQEEYIGKKIKIIESKNKEQTGIEGMIIDETKNMFTIKTKNKTIKILKQDKTFTINEKKICGNKIQKRPEERIKLKRQ